MESNSNFKMQNLKQYFKMQAYKCYLEALGIQPTFAIAWSNLAGLFMEAGDLNRAAQYYKEAVKFKPTFADAYLNLGNVYKFVGLQNLIQRNQELCASGNIITGGVSLPFILVQIFPHATVEVEISEDMQLVHFDFNRKIIIGEDTRTLWSDK